MSTRIENNGVVVINNFLSDKECSMLINYIDSLESGWGNSNQERKMAFNPESDEIKDLVVKCLNKAKDIFGYEELYVAEYLLSFYSAGFSMSVHTDLEDGKDHFEVSIVTYLNNDFTGGDIVFPILGFRHQPKKGDIALFLSKPETNIHGVEEVISGKRYVMPIWTTTNKDFAFNLKNKGE